MTSALIAIPFLKQETSVSRSPEDRLQEATGLALSIDVQVADGSVYPLSRIRPSHYFGEGHTTRLKELAEQHEATLLIVDTGLSPVQQRNLEKACGLKVIDRTGLILEIFGSRARTHEGKLQVELAALTYQKSRLVRSWTHLERQRGGFGFMGGPGESQIEIDRRLIGNRIDKIRKELADVRRTRGIQRTARQEVPWPVVALVGYTNAGKSTLFNRLTGSGVLAKDMLFATLDPTMRVIPLKTGSKVILSDTVGFVADLPTLLVEAFRATLEEVLSADVILHVRDRSHPECSQQKKDVLQVLSEIGLDETTLQDRMLEVWNKVDALPDDERTLLLERAHHRRGVFAVSALTGEGIPALLEGLEAHLTRDFTSLSVTVPAGDGETMAWLHEHGRVQEQTLSANGETCTLNVKLGTRALALWEKRQGIVPNNDDDY